MLYLDSILYYMLQYITESVRLVSDSRHSNRQFLQSIRL